MRVLFKAAWRSGAAHADMSADKFLARLCALVPPPGFHMTRYFGVFANRHHLGPRIIPPSAVPTPGQQLALGLADSANVVHHAMGDHDLARPRYERALAVLEETLGPDHPTVGLILVGLANVHTFAGAHDLARPLLERAVAIQEAKGSDHRDIARSLERLGEAFLGERRPAQALPLFERALAIYAAHDGARRREAVAQFGAARALVATGGDRKRALALARAAREGLRRKAHAVGAVDLAEVERWLATQEGEGFRGARPAARRTP